MLGTPTPTGDAVANTRDPARPEKHSTCCSWSQRMGTAQSQHSHSTVTAQSQHSHSTCCCWSQVPDALPSLADAAVSCLVSTRASVAANLASILGFLAGYLRVDGTDEARGKHAPARVRWWVNGSRVDRGICTCTSLHDSTMHASAWQEGCGRRRTVDARARRAVPKPPPHAICHCQVGSACAGRPETAHRTPRTQPTTHTTHTTTQHSTAQHSTAQHSTQHAQHIVHSPPG